MQKNKLFLFCSLVFAILFSCEEEKENQRLRDNTGLPYIGQHDVVYQTTEEHKAGDTLFHKVPSFSYLNQDSTVLSSEDIKGKVWIAKFFFTHCPTICPPMTSAMKQVNEALSDYQDDLVFLSFSIDPDRDNPKRLRKYIERHDIEAQNWYFLTGNEKATHRLGVKGFQILAQADDNAPGGYAHSPNFVLVDEQGYIRGVYDGLDSKSREQLITDAKKLLNDE